MGNTHSKEDIDWTPVRKVRMAFYALLGVAALILLAALANWAGLDITHLVVTAIGGLITLAVAYMSKPD